MVKNWAKNLYARAHRVCENLRLKHHPGYAPKTNTNINTNPNHKGDSHATEAHESKKLPPPVQARRKACEFPQPYPPHERRHQALICGASTRSTAFMPEGVESRFHDLTLSVFQ